MCIIYVTLYYQTLVTQNQPKHAKSLSVSRCRANTHTHPHSHPHTYPHIPTHTQRSRRIYLLPVRSPFFNVSSARMPPAPEVIIIKLQCKLETLIYTDILKNNLVKLLTYNHHRRSRRCRPKTPNHDYDYNIIIVPFKLKIIATRA